MTMPTRAEIHPVLLRVLHQQGGSAPPRDVVAAVTQELPQLTADDLAATQKDGRSSLWRNRVHWARQDLAYQGLIDGSTRGVWQLTDAGRQEAERLAESTPPRVVTPPLVEVAEDPPPGIKLLASVGEEIADALLTTATDSEHPDRLELAVANAMAFFGFAVRRIGGPGRTDVLAQAPLGPLRYAVVLDAKSTASGRVADSQINWLGIRAHREAEGADCACIVGPDFAGGVLRTNAEQFNTALLSASQLAELVRLHEAHPLTLIELRAVFASAPDASRVLADVRSAAHARGRRWALVRFVLETIDRFNRENPNDVLAKPEVLWGTVLAGGNEAVRGATRDDVADALQLLETVGAIAKSNGDGYVSQTSLAGALNLLRSFGAQGYEDAEQTTVSDSTLRALP